MPTLIYFIYISTYLSLYSPIYVLSFFVSCSPTTHTGDRCTSWVHGTPWQQHCWWHGQSTRQTRSAPWWKGMRDGRYLRHFLGNLSETYMDITSLTQKQPCLSVFGNIWGEFHLNLVWIKCLFIADFGQVSHMYGASQVSKKNCQRQKRSINLQVRHHIDIYGTFIGVSTCTSIYLQTFGTCVMQIYVAVIIPNEFFRSRWAAR